MDPQIKPGILLMLKLTWTCAGCACATGIGADMNATWKHLVPPDKVPLPAVLVPFYEPETSIGLSKASSRDFALQLARRGFVTLSIGSPGGDARQPALGQATCQPLSFLAYVAANCANAL